MAPRTEASWFTRKSVWRSPSITSQSTTTAKGNGQGANGATFCAWKGAGAGSPIGRGDLHLVWTEREGPQGAPPDGKEGYGSKLVRRSVAGHLGGSIAYDWSANGVVVALKLKAERLAA